MHNVSSQMSLRILNTPHQCHYSGYMLIYTFFGDVMNDHEAPFSVNCVCRSEKLLKPEVLCCSQFFFFLNLSVTCGLAVGNLLVN